MHVSFLVSRKVEMHLKKTLFPALTVKFKLEYHTHDLLSRYYPTGKTAKALLHSSCFQMYGCVLLSDVANSSLLL